MKFFFSIIFIFFLISGCKTVTDKVDKASEKETKKHMDDGSSVIIFPEGTRKKPGADPNYKTGFIGIMSDASPAAVQLIPCMNRSW